MKYILDTHVLIWALNGNYLLSDKVIEIINNTHSELFVSIISFWEISIKKSIGKLDILYSTKDLIIQVKKLGIKIINLEENHILGIEDLPLYHKDPFDRLIISQSKVENFNLISKDEVFDNYITSRIW